MAVLRVYGQAFYQHQGCASKHFTLQPQITSSQWGLSAEMPATAAGSTWMERRAHFHSYLKQAEKCDSPGSSALSPRATEAESTVSDDLKSQCGVQHCHQPPQLQFAILGRVGHMLREDECLLVSDEFPVKNVLRLDEDERLVPGLPGAANQTHACLDRYVRKLSDGLGKYAGR